VALVFPSTGTYDTASVGTGKTVTASGLLLTGAKANDYTIVGSVSAPIGEITGVEAPPAPILTSVVAAIQASSSTSFFAQSTSIGALVNAQTGAPSPPPPPPTTVAATVPPTSSTLAPPPPNPLAALVVSSTGTGDQPAAEPPTSSDLATSLIIASLDGGFSPDGGEPGATTNSTTFIIPGLLKEVSGKTQTGPGSGDDLSAWGNPALWQ
jgi:hypothetical protein